MSADYSVTYATESRCWTCGVMVPCDYGQPREHTCKSEDVTRWEGYLEGWHEGYKFAAKNPADPMVMADRAEYGTGWAGAMRTGGLTISGCEEEDR